MKNLVLLHKRQARLGLYKHFIQLNLQHEIQYLYPIDCTLLNKEIQHVIKKIHPNKNLPAILAAQLSTTSKKQMVQVKRVTNKLGGRKKKKKQTKSPPSHYMTDHLELYKFTKSWELQSTQVLP